MNRDLMNNAGTKGAPLRKGLRIGFVSTMEGEAWGGSEELWSQAALLFAKNGYDVGVNVARWPQIPPGIAQLQAAGAAVTLRAPRSSSSHKRLQRITGDRTLNWLRSFSPDFVVLSQGSTRDAAAWARACCEQNIAFVTIAQAAYSYDWPEVAEVSEYSWAYEKARATFFVSQDNLDFTRQQLLQPLLNASVVRNPFNVPFDICLPWPASQSPLRLACVGRLHFSTKAQDVVIDVLRQPKWRERDLQVTFFGKGVHQHNIEKMLQMYEMTNVRLGGHVPDISEVWRENHALLLPSRQEGLPLAIVEAMLCGRPCIVSEVAGNAELIEDGVNGFVAAAPRFRSLDQTLERVWHERERLPSMGENAARAVREAVPADPARVYYDQLQNLINSPS